MNRYLWFLNSKQAEEAAPMSSYEEPTSDIQRTPSMPAPMAAPQPDPVEEEAKRMKLEMMQMSLQQKQEVHQQRMRQSQELHDVKLQAQMPPQAAPMTPDQSRSQLLSNYVQSKMGSSGRFYKVAKEIVQDGIACATPGEKIRSQGRGRGLAIGKGKGPVGRRGLLAEELPGESTCETPGEKIRSQGRGRGLAIGKGQGPLGRMRAKEAAERRFPFGSGDHKSPEEDPNFFLKRFGTIAPVAAVGRGMGSAFTQTARVAAAQQGGRGIGALFSGAKASILNRSLKHHGGIAAAGLKALPLGLAAGLLTGYGADKMLAHARESKKTE
jgi:hypothetical protein